jgi:dienelactone hydrolase
MRGVDYLQSRPEIDPNRIGCMGNSGGGTQTAYLTALDDRIAAASPSCFVTNYFERMIDGAPHGGRTADAEYQVFDQLVWGMGHADLLMMRAPAPVLICATTEDVCADIDRTWSTFRTAKRLYGRMGFAERIDLIEYDGKHHYHQPLREAATRWMMRWLLGIDKPVTEPAMKVLSDKEIQCTPGGQTMLLAGARSVYDLNQDFERELAKGRERSWAELDRDELLSQVREIAGIRKLEQLPTPRQQESDLIERPGHTITETTFDAEDGIVLKAKIFAPKKTPSREAVLYLHEDGRNADAASGGPIEKLVKEGHVVLAVDLRGVRESEQAFSAYLVGLSYVGMRAEDILVCARWLAENQATESPRQVRMIAVGNVGVPALHAAALEPKLFGSLKVIHSLISWSNIIEMKRSYNQKINAVHS